MKRYCKCPATQTSWIFDIFFCDFVVWSWFNIKQTNERSWSERERKKRRTVLMFNSVVSDFFPSILISIWYFFLWLFSGTQNRTKKKYQQQLIRRFRLWLGWASAFHCCFSPTVTDFRPFFLSLLRTIYYTHAYIDILYMTLLCNQMLLVNSSYRKSQRERGTEPKRDHRWNDRDGVKKAKKLFELLHTSESD